MVEAQDIPVAAGGGFLEGLAEIAAGRHPNPVVGIVAFGIVEDGEVIL